MPYMNIGPGEFIKEELEARNWIQEDLAEILGMSKKSVNQLIKNKQSITIETANLLSKAFGQSPQYWINLDANYRLRKITESQKVKDTEIKALIFKYMPIKDMVSKGWLCRYDSTAELVSQVLCFWNKTELDFSFIDKDSRLPNFRKSEAYSQFNEYYAHTWFNQAHLCAKAYEAQKYSKRNLLKLISQLHEYTTEDNGVKEFIDDLNGAGVKFLVLPHLQKTYIDGASFYDKSNPVIVYTLRYDRIDNFWFTVAHELAHIILHLKKKSDYFIDNLSEINTEIERQADKLAMSILHIDEVLNQFEQYSRVSEQRVLSCASSLSINPAIVVGALHKYSMLHWRNLTKYKTKVSNLIPQECSAK